MLHVVERRQSLSEQRSQAEPGNEGKEEKFREMSYD
jgi:hypothetical protein